MEKKARDRRPFLAAGLAVVLWASAFPGIREGLHAYSPAHLALLRYAAASLTLGIYALVKRVRLPGWRDLLGIALAHIPASRAASFLYLQPLLVLGIAWIWLGEWPSVLALSGGVLVLAGVVVVNTRGQGPAETSPLRFLAERLRAPRRPRRARRSSGDNHDVQQV